jgi:hypothetical protein
VTDAPGDEPDLLAQATAAKPMTHAPRSSRHRRRRRGPSTSLIVGGVVVVVAVAAAAVIIATHHSANTPSANVVAQTWTHKDLQGHSVIVVAASSGTAMFSAVKGGQVPTVVVAIDKAFSLSGCTGGQFLYLGLKGLTTMKSVSVDERHRQSAFAAYALEKGIAKKCPWARPSGT